MTSPNPQRAIPRPSERRAARYAIGSGLSIVPDAHPPPTPSPQGSAGWQSLLLTLGLLGVLGSAIGFGFLGLTEREDTLAGLFVVPAAGMVGFFAIRRWVSRPHGEWLGAVVFAGFGLRLLAAIPRLMGGADAPLYQATGTQIAEALQQLNFGVDTGRSIPGTGSVRYLSGIVNVFTGSNYLATFIVFVGFAIVGQVAFMLGVRRTLTENQFRLFALLMMFSPTLAFWPSSIGKESPVLLGTGLLVFGASQLYDRSWRGVPYVVFGVFAIGMVRPHVAMMILLSMLLGLFARRAHTRGRLLSHLAVLVVVVVGSMWAASAAAPLFGLESLDGIADLNAALDFTEDRTSQDNAQFVAVRVERVRDYPWAFVTVLFRPFPWETASSLALVSAVEGIGLAILLFRALPGLIVHIGGVLQRGQMLFAVAYSAVFIFLFSAIGNFGILSRQRAQIVPFVLLLVAFGIAVESRGKRWSLR